MRVRRTVPPFTFGFSKPFVNRVSQISTVFFGFFLFFMTIRTKRSNKAPKNALFVEGIL
jgi:hypothetical protein